MVKKNVTLKKRRQEIINQILDLNAQTRPFFELDPHADNPFTPEEKEVMTKQDVLLRELNKLDEKIGNKILWVRR